MKKRGTAKRERAADQDARVEAEIEAASGVLTRALDSYLDNARAQIAALRAEIDALKAERGSP